MASFTNLTNARVIVSDEFGIQIGFEPGETLTGQSNYLARFTSSFLTNPEDIVLQLNGNLDTEAVQKSAVVEEENMAVRPSQGNRPTQGVNWTQVGGVRSADIPLGHADMANNALRLRKMGFQPEFDDAGRQIDTRHCGLKSVKDLGVLTSEDHAANALDEGGGADAVTTLTVGPAEYNGRRATAADVANGTYGSLLNEGQYYTAFGTFTYHDDSEASDFLGGFAISGTTVTVTDATAGTALTALTAAFVCSTGVLTWTRSGGEAVDTIASTTLYAAGISTATIANTNYDAVDAIRGDYWIDVLTVGSGENGLLRFSDDGILSIIVGDNPAFVAWT